MTTLTYTPRFRSSELVANLIDSYWDEKGGTVTKPLVIEKPYETAKYAAIAAGGFALINRAYK